MIHSIGLTGGIGSGKSTIAGILKQLGYPVYLADPEASRLINRSGQICIPPEECSTKNY